MSKPGPIRRPTGLVSDSRDPQNVSRRPPGLRFISVDNVLAGRNEMSSAEARIPANRRMPSHPPPGAARAADPRGKTTIRTRSTKLSEKLVLLPEAEQVSHWRYDPDSEDRPPQDSELRDQSETPGSQPQKTFAERLPKIHREDHVSRVTAYCTAEGYRLSQCSEFLKTQHLARTKLYDECLYCAYHLPLMGGTKGYRVRSSPVLKSPGGKPVVDVHLEESERADYADYYPYENEEEEAPAAAYPEPANENGNFENGMEGNSAEQNGEPVEGEEAPRSRSKDRNDELVEHMKSFAEMFIFSYGVVVFWNFTERQEKDVLADITFASNSTSPTLIRDPLKEQDFETEDFHFEYSNSVTFPRIFNDMITLRSGDMMVKLAISHAIAQSTKLCRFEERMAKTMTQAHHIPKRLALTGNLGMKREDVNKLSGRLFRLRVDVNLNSNVLDVPEFFWDSEPTLYPLYRAVRDYLEIEHRILVLNDRCRVFLDLAQLLADSIADSNMSWITWIIIVLICISLVVTGAEVIIRVGLIAGKHKAVMGRGIGGLVAQGIVGMIKK
ncbi:DUF155-domain-containing protein [Ascobolus immersus RN42]|uniref:DUF155-domain-containing protein n=1 Tax=Ascobolus immersus RN42 TaxID=1160509 RepID=A0A3N4ICA9_ASCIM|nr:DUF155-domain-containing protein [Ascobolus immersus RN42]